MKQVLITEDSDVDPPPYIDNAQLIEKFEQKAGYMRF